jgi:hypothetical protein
MGLWVLREREREREEEEKRFGGVTVGSHG